MILRKDRKGSCTPGTWIPITLDDQLTAKVFCPDCGQGASLADHSIYPDGEVQPSLVCPMENCSFHEFVSLEGW